MAFTPTNQLNSDPQVFLRDQQHAARLFVDDQFKFLPKQRFLFHVSFGINQDALTDKSLIQKHRNEINMLVKSTDLPGYEITTETLNQYNRTKVVQSRHKPKSITIKFHDDNYSVINKLWQNYYKYYYRDTSTADTGRGYDRTAMKHFDYLKGTYGYTGALKPFFNYITIYQLARHDYVGYKLINPVVTGWEHSKVDYGSKESNEFEMKIDYEAVSYSSGEIGAGTPEGFGLDHYDQSPSPLSTGVSTSASTTIPQPSSSNIITQQINNYQNVQTSVAPMSALLGTATPGLSGIQGISFPGTVPTSTVVQASLVNL